MRRVQKPKFVNIKYPKKLKRNGTESINATLHQIQRRRTGLVSPQDNFPRFARQQIGRRYYHWRRWRNTILDQNRIFLNIQTWRNFRIDHQRRVRENGADGLRRSLSERHIPVESLEPLSSLVIGDSNLSDSSDENLIRDRVNSSRGDIAMSQNDSIIWNNRSSDQVTREIESNLSLVVNPPSSLSQHEDSVVSDDSQYTRSSQLDLALEDERRWIKYRIDNLSRDECIITCVLAQMMLSPDELPGTRDLIPCDEESKQSLLYLSYGGHWEINNLRTVLDLAEFLPVGLRRLCGLGVRDRGSSSRKVLEGRLEQCLDLTRRLNLQSTG